MKSLIRTAFVFVSLLCSVALWSQQPASNVSPSAGPAPSGSNIVPRLVKFSGVANDDAGKPLSGTVAGTFSLYSEQQGGEPLWTETQSLQPDAAGRYSVLLGATQAEGLPAEMFTSGEARWLGAQIQGQPEQPRTLLVSVPYAITAVEAEKLGGKSVSDFVLSESLGDQVRQVIQAQSENAGQATSTGLLQQGQTKANTTSSPQVAASGPKFPPSTFSGTNSTQIVSVQQNGSGNGIYSFTAGLNGFGVFGQASNTAGNATGVVGLTNSLTGSGVYGQTDNGQQFGFGVLGNATATTGNTAGVGGLTASPNGSGVTGAANASSGFNSGVFGQSASSNGTGVFGTSVQWVGVGGQATAPSGGPAFGVWGDSLSTGGTGVAGFEDAPSGYTSGVYGQSVSPNGTGMLAFNGASTDGIGVRGIASGTSGFGFGVVGESYSRDGRGVIAQNFASNGGVGVFGVADATSGPAAGVIGESSSSAGNGVFGGNNAASGGIGLSGLANGTTGNAYGVFGATATTGFGAGVLGTAFATNGTAFGVFADAHSPNGNAIFGHAAATSGYPSAVVGFLDSQQGGVAGQFVARGGAGLILQGLSGSSFNQVFSVDANGNVNISGNLTVSGTKSSTAKLQNGREVALYAVESPENWFEDFGNAALTSGVAWVPLDASFAQAVNATADYHVFLTSNGDSNGLYVARKTPAGFEVREHGGTTSNVAFDYRIVARRRGYETVRMAEVARDVKTVEVSRQGLAELANSGNLGKVGRVEVPRTVAPPAIRPTPPRPSIPKRPVPNVPQAPRVQ